MSGVGGGGARRRPGARRRTSPRTRGRAALGLLGPLALLAAWEAYVRLAAVDPLVLPGPLRVATALGRDRDLLLDGLAATTVEVVAGLAVALLCGAVLAVALHAVRGLRAACEPVLVASQAVPLPVLAPVLVLWLGFDLGPKVAIVAIVCFFPVTVAALDALDRTDPDLSRVLTTLGAGRWRRLWWVDVPSALPAALSGARVAVAVAGVSAVFAEYAGSERGLGHVILQAQPALATDRAFAAVALVALLTVSLTLALGALARRVAPWAHLDPRGERA